jgi:hypothetical protein
VIVCSACGGRATRAAVVERPNDGWPAACPSNVSPELSQKIAAGEVIDRPVSVVGIDGELIDAGSRNVESICATAACRNTVRDGGCGMTVDDLRLAASGARRARSAAWNLGALRR